MKTNYREGEQLEFNENGDTQLFGLKYTEMVYVEIGTFNIGDNSSGEENEQEATVTLNDGYFIGKYPITQELYEAIIGINPSNHRGRYRPVETVSLVNICKSEDCFIKQLNVRLKEKYPMLKGVFELPSESQWEYAAKGGKAWNNSKFQFAGSNNIHDVTWFERNSNARTMPVGLKQPNVLGLYDMSGNVLEWCKDKYTRDYSGVNKDIIAIDRSSIFHVLRGGHWSNAEHYCRVTSRGFVNPEHCDVYIGLRLVFNINPSY